MTVAERVADGVAVLDEMNPGWWDGMDVETLRMEFDGSCVLGQVYGSYETGVMLLTGRHAGETGWDQDHGFAQTVFDEPWAPLQAEWVRVITARQAADPVLASEPEMALD